jgi:hypothetical protein
MERSPTKARPNGGVLTDEDIIQLQLVPFIALVEALADSNLIPLDAVADHIEARLTPDDRDPWAAMARAIVTVLRGFNLTPESQTAPAGAKPTLTIVGGRQDDPVV